MSTPSGAILARENVTVDITLPVRVPAMGTHSGRFCVKNERKRRQRPSGLSIRGGFLREHTHPLCQICPTPLLVRILVSRVLLILILVWRALSSLFPHQVSTSITIFPLQRTTRPYNKNYIFQRHSARDSTPLYILPCPFVLALCATVAGRSMVLVIRPV
jgi:hypothetical protein